MIAKMLEITTKIGCRLDCRFCPQQLLTAAYNNAEGRNSSVLCPAKESLRTPAANMSFATFKTCVDKLPPDIDIHFSGMCEPWLNGECTKMVLYAHEKGHKIHVYTTLVGMKQRDYLQLRALPLETFVLHIPDAEGNSKFVLDAAYLALVTQVLEDAAAGRFAIRSCSCHGTVHPAVRLLVEKANIPVNNQMYDRAGNVHETCDISGGAIKQGPIICRWCGGNALDKNVLLPDGTVLLCCMDYGMEFPLGNLLDQSFAEISEGAAKKQYRALLESTQQGMILCRICHRSRAAE